MTLTRESKSPRTTKSHQPTCATESLLYTTGLLEDAELAKDDLEELIQTSKQPETTTLWRTICRWWKEIEVLIVTGATTGKSQRTTQRR